MEHDLFLITFNNLYMNDLFNLLYFISFIDILIFCTYYLLHGYLIVHFENILIVNNMDHIQLHILLYLKNLMNLENLRFGLSFG